MMASALFVRIVQMAGERDSLGAAVHVKAGTPTIDSPHPFLLVLAGPVKWSLKAEVGGDQ